MLQHAEPAAPAAEEAGHAAPEAFDAGTIILGHVANSPIDHPLIPLPTIVGINLSVTKHVLMLWIAAAFLLIVTTVAVRRYVRRGTMVPSGPVMGLIEYVAVRIRDEIVGPNVGSKWVNTYTPLIILFFLFIVTATSTGRLPSSNRWARGTPPGLSFREDTSRRRGRPVGRRPAGRGTGPAALPPSAS